MHLEIKLDGVDVSGKTYQSNNIGYANQEKHTYREQTYEYIRQSVDDGYYETERLKPDTQVNVYRIMPLTKQAVGLLVDIKLDYDKTYLLLENSARHEETLKGYTLESRINIERKEGVDFVAIGEDVTFDLKFYRDDTLLVGKEIPEYKVVHG